MLSEVTIGQFFETGSAIHKLDSRLKFALMFLYMFLMFMLKSILAFILNFAVVLVLYVIAKIPIRMLWKNISAILPMIFIAALVNLFLVPGDDLFRFLGIGFSKQGVLLVILMILRLLCFVAMTALLMHTTSPISLTDAIEWMLRPFKFLKISPGEIAMMLSIALRFVPTLLSETNRIVAAQKSRGACFESKKLMRRVKAYIPVIVPLLFSAFERAQELAVAMESRCYCGGEGRTKFRKLEFGFNDGISLFFALGYIVALLWVNNLATWP